MPQSSTPAENATADYRSRLLEGMARALASNGYAGTTIADIVREASVSRRTFYEHFSTKAECLIALYEAASLGALNVLQDAIDPRHAWQIQAQHAMSAYLGCLARNPLVTRALFIEILGLGSEGLAARRRVNRQIAAFMLKVINAPRDKRRPKQLLSEDMAAAVVGGINELILQYIEQDRTSHLQQLTQSAVRLLCAVAPTDAESGARHS